MGGIQTRRKLEWFVCSRPNDSVLDLRTHIIGSLSPLNNSAFREIYRDAELVIVPSPKHISVQPTAINGSRISFQMFMVVEDVEQMFLKPENQAAWLLNYGVHFRLKAVHEGQSKVIWATGKQGQNWQHSAMRNSDALQD